MLPLTLLVTEMNGQYSVTLDSHASLEEAQADYAQANPEERVHDRLSFDLICGSEPYDAIRAICDASDQEGGIRDALEEVLTSVLNAGLRIARDRMINAHLTRVVEEAFKLLDTYP